MPPPGGFEPIKYKRHLPFRGPSSAVILAGIFGVSAYGFYRLGLGNLERRSVSLFILLARFSPILYFACFISSSAFPTFCFILSILAPLFSTSAPVRPPFLRLAWDLFSIPTSVTRSSQVLPQLQTLTTSTLAFRNHRYCDNFYIECHNR